MKIGRMIEILRAAEPCYQELTREEIYDISIEHSIMLSQEEISLIEKELTNDGKKYRSKDQLAFQLY